MPKELAVLDSKIRLCKEHFGIITPEDWQDVRPEWILGLDGIGPVTLEHIRLYLAARNLALKDDNTPEYWREHLSRVKIGHQMGDEDSAGGDAAIICPFTVMIDSAETLPFTFQGLTADADQGHRPLIVPTQWGSLGRFPDSYGDYSVAGHVGRVGIERKSMDDAHGTILGFDGRRQRFEKELSNLANIDAAMVVIECTLGQLVNSAPSWGKRTAAQNKKTLFRSVVAFQHEYGVPWLFCDSRRMAEVAAFRFLERYHCEQVESEGERALPPSAPESDTHGQGQEAGRGTGSGSGREPLDGDSV